MSTVHLTIYRHEGPLLLPIVHEGSISSCRISDDCKLLVSSGYDLKIILWDLENLTQKLILRVSEYNSK